MTSNHNNAEVDRLCINTIRALSLDAIRDSKSGHPGLPLGAAPFAYLLWQYHMKHNPKDPHWFDRDRFILSPGHGSMLLYSLLHLAGYGLSMDQIKKFRQWGSLTPGHPEFGLTQGVETTTGPLGQGAANAIGMAMAERKLANLFNQDDFNMVDHMTWALVSDGDLMEGVVAEAASLAGHLGLGKLVYLYDSNEVSLDGPTTMTFSSEDVNRRFESYGWQVLYVKDGDEDYASINAAIEEAKNHTSQPTLIHLRTTIGYGHPKAGTSMVHGNPPTPEETVASKKELGWDYPEDYYVPPEVSAHFETSLGENLKTYEAWKQKFEAYQEAHPELARMWKDCQKGVLPPDGMAIFPFSKKDRPRPRENLRELLSMASLKR